MAARPWSFVVTVHHRLVEPQLRVVLLQRDRWDDHGYRTTFRAFTARRGRWSPLGDIKILDLGGSLETSLDESFERLSPKFVSLVQDVTTYEYIAKNRPELVDALRRLNDLSVVPSDVTQHPGFAKSLARFAPARLAYARGREALRLESGDTETRSFALRLRCKLLGFDAPHTLSFDFSSSKHHKGLRRIGALVGRNGTGKTQLLTEITRTLSGLEEGRRDSTIASDEPFSSFVVVSYSPFDPFGAPYREDPRVGVVYAILRRFAPEPAKLERASSEPRPQELVIDLADATQRVARDAAQLRGDQRREWLEALDDCGLLSEGGALAPLAGRPSRLAELMEGTSSGERILAMVLTRLVRHVRRGTLVLIDEPEAHLHPAAVSSLMRTLHRLLEKRDAYAILSTHSPIPLQELPACMINVLSREGTLPIAQRLAHESFGENLGSIVQTVFPSEDGDRNFASLVRDLDTSNAEALEEILGGPLTLGARLALDVKRRREEVR